MKLLHAPPNHLPRHLSSFIGREWELAEVESLLSTTRLLTLTGPGGVGKTRLALRAAVDSAEHYEDGLWLVDLAPLRDPALIPQLVTAAVGIAEQRGRSALETLSAYLQPRWVLLLLDNCEHLLDACAQLGVALLQACPHVRILATSREALNVPGELAWVVPSLSAPDSDNALDWQRLDEYQAVRLFLERARAADPSFSMTQRCAPSVVEICAQLDGIPLALELAAARMRVLDVEQLAARLDDRFRLLTAGSRTSAPRHQTLQALIDWSYDLLSDAERVLFRRISVFAGGWSLDAAETVCADQSLDRRDILDLLCRLIEKSLVLVDPRAGEKRYRLLETLREYAAAKLRISGGRRPFALATSSG